MEYCDEFFANLARSGIGTLVIQAKFKSPPWCGPGSWAADAVAGAQPWAAEARSVANSTAFNSSVYETVVAAACRLDEEYVKKALPGYDLAWRRYTTNLGGYMVTTRHGVAGGEMLMILERSRRRRDRAEQRSESELSTLR